MSNNNEFETTPVSAAQLQPARHFAASYAGEHVAGTEFVIGAMFVAWGVGTADILWGLLWGNLLAVLTWGFVCAPIATDTRLTLYAYLQRIAGPGTLKIYSVVNGLAFCVLAGAMITVSASAVRILFDIPAQVNWYPTSLSFVLLAICVGAVVVAVAAKGFRRVAEFAEVCSPWMILMFFVGALAVYPVLREAIAGESASAGFMDIADRFIWKGDKSELTLWHVAAFAWVCNLSMHGGMSDMTVLRFARKSQYGFFSALGMFIGHYLAWVCAGIMGAGAALVLKESISVLDPGAVAFEALGGAGILAVILAGWTTSNPTIYRAGLAFQSLNPNWNRTRVTIFTGVATTLIACFPFVFTKLMDFVGLMGLLLVPMGTVIVTEHWIFPRLGLTRYWSHYRGETTNKAAVISWLIALAVAWMLNQLGVHLFFLLIPVWLTTTVAYILLARLMGAKQHYPQAAQLEADHLRRKQQEKAYLDSQTDGVARQPGRSLFLNLNLAIAVLSLLACFGLGLWTFSDGNVGHIKQWLWLPSLIYFVVAILWVVTKSRSASAAQA